MRLIDMTNPVNTNINVLHALMRPGETLSHKAIAQIVGCSHGLIFNIEKKALKKVREHLRRENKLTFGEFSVTKSRDIL